MHTFPRVAIVGAGIAGLSCATALAQAGLDIALFEKSRGPGGRMSTRRVAARPATAGPPGAGGEMSREPSSEPAWQCDHGARYFTARDPAFAAEVVRWQQAGVAAPWMPRFQVLGGGSAHSDFSADLGDDLGDNFSDSPRWVGTPRMTAPAQWLAAPLALRLQSTVSALHPQAGGWALSSAEHGRIEAHFDALVLALPAPQAAALLRTAAPAVADLAALAAAVPMRGCWVLMLRYAAPLALPFDAAVVNSGPLRWIARDTSKPGRSGADTWLLQASADWSALHIEDSPDAVAAALLDAFNAHGGPTPQAWTAHRWRYADAAPASMPGAIWQADALSGAIWQADRGIGLCGDWLHAGGVEGAWLSGRQLAQALLAGGD
jgi:hypothetical protein